MPRYFPTFDDYTRLSAEGRLVPVYRQLTSDGLTPVSAFLKLPQSGQGFLFESVVGGEKVGRYSFLGTGPFETFLAHGRTIATQNGACHNTWQSDDPIDDLRKVIESYRVAPSPGLPRFCGGAVGFAAYDAVRYVENLPAAPPDDRGLPDLAFGLYSRMVIFDHIRKTIMVVALARAPQAGSGRPEYDAACRDVDEIVTHLSASDPVLPPLDIDIDGSPALEPRSNFTRDRYEDVVRQCQEYIRAGDIFQVVPSQRFEVQTSAHPFEIYRALRVLNPSPFLFYLPFGDFCLIGSSPEILVRVEAGTVTIRPIAGTRRRGRDEAEDRALADELLADPKERAEHIMLVDLGRNDVGRVAEPGSVRITELMQVERYSHVMHITSNVQGTLRPGLTAFDALRAGLPAGTVSGAPKVRAMQIIDQFEPQKRGPYAGAVGYLDFSGNMDTCIALRTVVVQGDRAYVQAGGGVVYDSDPAAEYEETVNKARALIKAIDVAQAQLAPSAPRLPKAGQ